MTIYRSAARPAAHDHRPGTATPVRARGSAAVRSVEADLQEYGSDTERGQLVRPYVLPRQGRR